MYLRFRITMYYSFEGAYKLLGAWWWVLTGKDIVKSYIERKEQLIRKNNHNE